MKKRGQGKAELICKGNESVLVEQDRHREREEGPRRIRENKEMQGSWGQRKVLSMMVEVGA